MKPIRPIALIAFMFSLCIPLPKLNAQAISPEKFMNPPIQYWPRPLWFWNNTTVDGNGITMQMQAMHDLCGYGGFGIVPFGKKFRPEYLSGDYLALYGVMLKKAKELGMTISLYDEFGFPSGSIGAFDEGDGKPRFQLKYPDRTIRRLDNEEAVVTGPTVFAKKVPDGKLMGIVAMDTSSLKRVDITREAKDGILKWEVPAGTWKVMIFTCVLDGRPVVDYLDPDACRLFTREVHDGYDGRFAEYFGTTIGGTFFDEPSMFNAQFRT